MNKIYTIRHIPAFNHLGKAYPEQWHVSRRCSRGLLWEAGEFLSREAAVAATRRSFAA